jgi:hypothetical protein
LAWVLLHHPPEPAHDQLVLPLRHAVPAGFVITEAANHRLYQGLSSPYATSGLAMISGAVSAR